MKYRWDRRYLHWSVSAVLVIICSILFYYVLFENHSVLNGVGTIADILKPIIYGGVIAYLLRPLVDILEKKPASYIKDRLHLKETKRVRKWTRLIATVITFIIAVFVIYALMYFLIPQVFYSIQSLIEKFPEYYDNFQKWLLGLLKDYPELETAAAGMISSSMDTLEGWLSGTFIPRMNDMIGTVSTGIVNVFVVLKNVFLGCFVAIYILNSKEILAAQVKKLIYAVFSKKHADYVMNVLRLTDQNFSGFLNGKLLDSLIIGLICFAYTSIMNVPYYVLISVVIGVTNIIPFFGPYIGAIPCIFLILIVDPKQSLYFFIFVILLQTFDGNFLGPKILGNKTGLGSFYVLCSILIFGNMFGVIGMIIGVPVTSVIYAGIRTYADHSLRKKNLPTEVYHYMDLSGLDKEPNTAENEITEERDES